MKTALMNLAELFAQLSDDPTAYNAYNDAIALICEGEQNEEQSTNKEEK